MIISNTRINRKMRRKTDSELVETIIMAKKLKPWNNIANLISRPRRMQSAINVEDIDKETKLGDTVLIPGKVLGNGKITKKIRVAALSFSQDARRKLKEEKCEIVTIKEEIKANPKANGLRILK